MSGEPGEGLASTPFRPKASKFPMNPFVADELNASE